MNIDIIKKEIEKLKECNIKLKVNLGRNKSEYYEGKIEKIHPNIFVVMTNKGIKTFSYSDIASRQVLISKFN